jgi:integrating conjugative element membrane protein (TIGR03747 family)
MATAKPQQTRSAQQVVEQGLISRSFTTVIQFGVFAAATLFFAIVIEWIGMSFFWSDQGSRHSARMLEQELSYLNSDFKRSALVEEPRQFAQHCSDNFYDYAIRQTGIEKGLHWLADPGDMPPNPRFRAWLRHGYQWAADYILAALQILSLFAVRLAVLVLSVPAFVLLSLIGVIDGLVQRDIRRWSGGRESSFIYHWAKKLIMPSLTLPWMLYLAMPISLHPNLIVLPFAVIFAIALTVMTSTFKKYL